MALSTTAVLKRIVGPVNVSNGTNTNVFTGTNNHRYTIKQIRILNPTAGAITVKLGIGGVTDPDLFMGPVTLAAGDTFNDDINMLVLEGAEVIQSNATATGCTLIINALDQS